MVWLFGCTYCPVKDASMSVLLRIDEKPGLQETAFYIEMTNQESVLFK